MKTLKEIMEIKADREARLDEARANKVNKYVGRVTEELAKNVEMGINSISYKNDTVQFYPVWNDVAAELINMGFVVEDYSVSLPRNK